MSSGFGNTPKDSTNIPLGSVAVPGTSNGDLTALQGGPASSDSNSNSSAPVSTYTYSGNFVDFGQTTSSAATTDTGTFTFMAFVKRILQKLTSLVSNTSAFVDNATTGATLQTIGDTASLANTGAQGTWQIEIVPNSTFVGTILFEGLSLDGTTWGAMTGHLAGSSSMASSSVFTGTGNVTQIWRGNSSTYKQVRARLSAVSASNATVYIGLSAAFYAVSITNQVQTNLDQVNGTTLSSGNPVPTLDSNSAAMATELGAPGDTALTNPASSGSLSAFSKGAVKILSDVWDSVNHRLHVFVDNAVALGQATMQYSSPVTIASDQSNLPFNLKQLNSATISPLNAFIVESNITNWIRNGQAFLASNGNSLTATNANVLACPLSIFNPSNSGKNILIYSILISTNASEVGHDVLNQTTVDPSGGTNFTQIITPVNMKFGGNASVVSVCATATGISTNITPTGTTIESLGIASGGVMEVLTNGTALLLPAGSAYGIEIAIRVTNAGGCYTATAKWIEF